MLDKTSLRSRLKIRLRLVKLKLKLKGVTFSIVDFIHVTIETTIHVQFSYCILLYSVIVTIAVIVDVEAQIEREDK